MKIDILGGSYQAKYPALNCQRTINWYPVLSADVEQNKNPIALYPSPGLTSFVDIGSGTYWRGFYVASSLTSNRCFAVRDNILYEILENKTFINRGTMANMTKGASRVYMTVNNSSELAIYHLSASYVFNLLNNTLTIISSSQFPGSVTYAAYLDTFNAIVSGGAAWISSTGSALVWVGTQTYNTTFTASPIIALGIFQECIYNFTNETIEIYSADPTATSVYIRQPKTTINIGIVAKDSLARSNNGFYFLGKNSKGESSVYFLNGNAFGSNSCTPLSPPSITWRLNSLGRTLTSSYGYVQYSKDGHIFYYLHVPELKTTFVYDETTKIWHERQSKKPNNDSDGNNIYSIYRGKFYVDFNGLHLFADIYSSKILIEDYDNFTEDGSTIIRDRISQIIAHEQLLISATSLELEYDPGHTLQNYNIQISFSYNGGNSFQMPKYVALGNQGDYDHRLNIYKMGAARRWAVWLRVSDPVDLMIQSAIVQGNTASY